MVGPAARAAAKLTVRLVWNECDDGETDAVLAPGDALWDVDSLLTGKGRDHPFPSSPVFLSSATGAARAAIDAAVLAIENERGTAAVAREGAWGLRRARIAAAKAADVRPPSSFILK